MPMQHQLVLAGMAPGVSAEVLADEARTAIEDRHRRRVKVLDCRWVITRTPEGIDRLPFPGDCGDCPTCQAGRDQARAHLAAHPDEHVVLGLITFDWANY